MTLTFQGHANRNKFLIVDVYGQNQFIVDVDGQNQLISIF